MLLPYSRRITELFLIRGLISFKQSKLLFLSSHGCKDKTSHKATATSYLTELAALKITELPLQRMFSFVAFEEKVYILQTEVWLPRSFTTSQSCTSAVSVWFWPGTHRIRNEQQWRFGAQEKHLNLALWTNILYVFKIHIRVSHPALGQSKSIPTPHSTSPATTGHPQLDQSHTMLDHSSQQPQPHPKGDRNGILQITHICWKPVSISITFFSSEKKKKRKQKKKASPSWT